MHFFWGCITHRQLCLCVSRLKWPFYNRAKQERPHGRATGLCSVCYHRVPCSHLFGDLAATVFAFMAPHLLLFEIIISIDPDLTYSVVSVGFKESNPTATPICLWQNWYKVYCSKTIIRFSPLLNKTDWTYKATYCKVKHLLQSCLCLFPRLGFPQLHLWLLQEAFLKE